MAYSNFTLRDVKKAFQLEIREEMGSFASTEPVPISDSLATTLAENIPLAVSINTEKARSELIVVNILLEIRKIFQKQVSLFSGVEFTVDKDRGLTGYCDFLLSQSPEQLFVSAPVIAIVEAKNDNMMSELGQCASEMVAAQIFNQREEHPIPNIYGTVTTGTGWIFLKLAGAQVSVDLKEYSIDQPGKIIGILSSMLRQEA
ncbi:hypothetical protein QUF80_23650 [Desulfococcaceae bacterium HSG8]|nr:hypothetical protein [Desulfococcaceae bacterium HSG8]